MIFKKGQPISGSAPQFKRKAPVLTNQATTSAGAQRIVKRPPQIFADPQGSLNVPAPTNASNRANQNFAKDAMRFGGTGRAVSVRNMADPDFRAVGYAPGATKPKAYGASIISGYPTRGNAQRVGTGNQPFAKSNMPKLRPGQAKNYPSLMGGYRP